MLDQGPFVEAVKANRTYLLELDPDRLLAPFAREAGLEMKARPYGNWESGGLDGHTAGHYLSALSTMIASGADTPDGELRRRLNYMVAELDRCQKAWTNGYVGGVPGSRALWNSVAAGQVEAVNGKWVPWYNLHKTFAGLRDACLIAGNPEAREVFIHLGDWCVNLISGLSDQQMQRMLRQEHGGMNEVLADLYALTGDQKFIVAARRFSQQAILEPLEHHEDRLTGLHANTQIPKVIGLERIATLTGDQEADSGARFFWDNVTGKRSVAFGGNSVSEHFNDPKNFEGMLESREGPETCNTYNMLRLTEQLFVSQPGAAYADYYERALYNHILASINPEAPGYVYFTPIRPEHYRVYSQPDTCFWCCVGTGMENPGKYGEFIYAQATNGLYVNLFIASELTAVNLGLVLRQETAFPDEPRTKLTLKLQKPSEFTLYLRHPDWVAAGDFAVRVNGKPVTVTSPPSSYAELRRVWHDGDTVEVELPMRTTVERLPDGSDWVAILHGPILLARPSGTNNLVGLIANGSRMGHVASGPLIPLDRAPVLLTDTNDLPQHVKPDRAAGPLHFNLVNVVEPAVANGLPLIPFFRLHDERYQMYWQLTTKEELAARHERLAAEERAKALREASTLDRVAPGEQQPEVEHDYVGQHSDSGLRNGQRWRRGDWFQYALNPRGEKNIELAVTYWGGDAGRTFDILANGELLATESLNNSQPGQFFEKRFSIPAKTLSLATDGHVTIKFSARQGSSVGGIYDVRLMKADAQ
ncbi:MAG: glycoside hydrolase family 127 protein [Verrucomicrobiae bacterium]|nr:glycoside hydrolase family 127 protein [Verrucomicrobiae bacterium]